MSEVLKTWLRDRLGIIVELNPHDFGLTTRDGTLLAQLLHSYDIIDNAQLNTITATEDPALARVNLKHLRVWLKFIGVDCDDETIENISIGRGITALRLFYKIFASLESKDKLHFITQQKEREKYIPNAAKFDVTTLSDISTHSEPIENPLAYHLAKNASVVAWHRNKFQGILERCKRARQQCIKNLQERRSVHEESSGNIVLEKRKVQVDSASLVREMELKDLQDFSDKHKIRSPGKYTYHELCTEKKIGERIEATSMNLEAAKMRVKCMKNRTRQTMATFGCKSRMEKDLTIRLWEKQMQDRESEFDTEIAKKLFSQSQYEKQMMTKLCEIRDQKRRIAWNRELVNRLVEERVRTENYTQFARDHELVVKEGEDIEVECVRLCELNRRIREEKLRNLENKRYRLCMEVLNDIIDISLQAVHYRASNDNCIPNNVWGQWKALFVKSQPIFDTIENIEIFSNPNPEEDVEEIFRAEIQRQDVLNDADFDNYLTGKPPWDEFMPEVDVDTQEMLRLGINVLGYIVHRLLEHMYPSEGEPEPAPVPSVSSACILLGVLDQSVYPIIQKLLEHRGVKVIRMADAINYCLLRYKEEITEFFDVDTKSVKSMDEIQEKITSTKAYVRKRNDSTVQSEKTSVKSEKTTYACGIDEQTQTPSSFPKDGNISELSQTAIVGKWTSEFLSLGLPISNELNTTILIEYLKSLTGISGWVLLDYPNTFEQMARLEMTLTGHKIALEDQEDDNLDEDAMKVNPALSKLSYDGENSDVSSVFRESRLVQDPIPKVVGKTFSSYMTAYIRVLPKPDNMQVSETDIYEILTEHTNPMDTFYSEQGLVYAVYYTSFDDFTLKRLCRLVIGDMSIPRVPSEELFGKALYELQDKQEEPRPSKAPIIKQLRPRSDSGNVSWAGESEYEGEAALHSVLGSVKDDPIPTKPGEDNWEWIKFPQAFTILEALAMLWINMETIYIENFKEIFSIKRFHNSSIVPYRNYVKQHMADFIRRPDVKQDMLHRFQTSYNDIAKDMRDNPDVKCELHCRVADFRKELWEICDERRKQAEEERRRIILQNWTAYEMIVVSNLYICMIECELVRYIDTMQLLQDYYTSMLQRPVAENRLPKYSLQRLEVYSDEYVGSNSNLWYVKASKPTAKAAPASKTGKNTAGKGPQVAPIIDCTNVRNEIADFLISVNKESYDPDQITCYQAVYANLLYVQKIIDSLAASVLDSLKKEQAAFTPDDKGRIQIPKYALLPTVNDALIANIQKRGVDLCQEWRSAVQFEVSRVGLTLKLLKNAAMSDIRSLYETMKLCFHNTLKDTNDRFEREMKSVNEMASVFCHAIEEGLPIQEELLLDGDRFVARTSVLMYPDEPAPPPEPIREAILSSQFRMGQLGRLMDVFRYVAPHGSMPERSFTYILEDMLICDAPEDGRMPYLPSSWLDLRPRDVSDLVAKIFNGVEYIDWREFIIYAMDIPMPSDEEILDARSQFVAMDPTLTEIVTREQFHSVNLWFSNCSSENPALKNLLHEDYQRDEEEMDEEKADCVKIIKSDEVLSSVALSQEDSSFSCKYTLTKSTFSQCSRNMTPRETLRLMLAKELLCEMFVSACHNVNYTAFLLAFSKEQDPRVGFGKALTLALGEKVCVSETEGEIFVTELSEQRRLAAEEEAIRNDRRKAAELTATSFIHDVLENTLDVAEGITISDFEDSNQCHGATVRVLIEELNEDSSLSHGSIAPSPPPGTKGSDGFETEKEVDASTILAEGYSKESLSGIGESVIIHWIPRDVCQSILVASLPWHARQPDILGMTSTCLHECLVKVYADLFDPEVGDEQDYALSHRLVNHEFIRNLLESTNSFTAKDIGNIVQGLLSKRSDLKQTSDC